MDYQELLNAIQGGKTIHLCGIGGVSMRALARLLVHMGAKVQGSDRDDSEAVKKLRAENIPVQIGHSPLNLGDASLVIRTAAIPDQNPEIVAARANGLPVLERAQAWGLLMRGYEHAICVAGTHGKTSTTSMLSSVLIDAQLDPTIMVGGELPLIGGSLHIGSTDLFVAEACEYKNSFLNFLPTIAMILNIDRDHLDFFSDTDDIIASFRKFAMLVPEEDGLVVANGENENVLRAIENCGRRVVTFGLGEHCDVHPYCITCKNGFYSFDVINGDQFYCSVTLKVPGEHNMLNALASAAAAIRLGIPGEVFSKGLSDYTGVGRRFEYKGNFQGAMVFDDYAHHPDEIAASLKTARSMDFKRIICVFQPHTYSRTICLFDEFAQALSLADVVVLSEIYAARETNQSGISSRDLAAKIPGSVFAPTFEDAAAYLRSNAREGDIVFTMGAGTINQLWDLLH